MSVLCLMSILFYSIFKNVCFRHYTYFIYKQPVYKQLALGWKIVKQLSGLNPFSLSNSNNYRSKKSGLFLSNKRKLDAKPTIRHNLAVKFKRIIRKILKSLIINTNFES